MQVLKGYGLSLSAGRNTEYLNSIQHVLETLVSVNNPSCNNDNGED
jgi:hypothetical protein